MWNFISPVNLIRYLIVWRVTSPLVHLPRYFPLELSQTLGTLIVRRLPTPQAREWRDALTAWEDAAAARSPDRQTEKKKFEEHNAPTLPSWPLESVLFAYPAKRSYGEGETILWELKLLGDSAEHGLFLETILPAMEYATTLTDERWHRAYSVWGRFEIPAIYAARGARWEPVVSAGRLLSEQRVTPSQWAEGLSFAPQKPRPFHRLTWLTPFDLNEVPTLQTLVDALMERMTLFLPGKRAQPSDVWALLTPDEQTAIWLALEQAHPPAGTLQRHTLEPSPRGFPGRWIGTQTFWTIPAALVPYLELASILHIGKQTHFGCGTFQLIPDER